MLKMYGSDLSTPANKVRFTANALGLKYEYKKVDLHGGENRRPEFLKLHPAGKIPVIDDDGFILFESNAISKYLCEKNKSPLYPTALKEKAIVDQWIDFISLHVGTAMSRVVFNRLFAPVIKVEVDERSMQDGLNFLSRFLPVVDQQLAKQGFLVSNQLTLADMNLLTTLDPAEAASIDLSGYKNIVKWRNNLKQKDFYTKCHKEYGETLKQHQLSSK